MADQFFSVLAPIALFIVHSVFLILESYTNQTIHLDGLILSVFDSMQRVFFHATSLFAI